MSSSKQSLASNTIWRRRISKMMLPAMLGVSRRLDRSVKSLPQLKIEPWMIRVEEALDKGLCRHYHLKENSENFGTDLGLVTGHMETCSKIAFAPVSQSKQPSRRVDLAFNRIRFVMSPAQRSLKKMTRKIHLFIARQTSEVKIAFYNGYARAIEKKLWLANAPAAWEMKTTRVYVCLLLLAPWKKQIRSVKHLHEILSKILGPSNLELLDDTGQPRTLAQLCRRIGLSFARPGAPKSRLDSFVEDFAYSRPEPQSNSVQLSQGDRLVQVFEPVERRTTQAKFGSKISISHLPSPFA